MNFEIFLNDNSLFYCPLSGLNFIESKIVIDILTFLSRY